jgi:hypothetical protein
VSRLDQEAVKDKMMVDEFEEGRGVSRPTFSALFGVGWDLVREARCVLTSFVEHLKYQDSMAMTAESGGIKVRM